MGIRILPALLLSCLAVSADVVAENSGDSNPDLIAGQWLTERGAIVRIEKHGEFYGGVIVAVSTPTLEQREDIDMEDPEDVIKGRPEFDGQDMVGVQILRGLEFQGKAVWKGEFYDAGRHKNFRAKITLQDLDNAQVRTAAILEEKKTVTWTRVKNPER